MLSIQKNINYGVLQRCFRKLKPLYGPKDLELIDSFLVKYNCYRRSDLNKDKTVTKLYFSTSQKTSQVVRFFARDGGTDDQKGMSQHARKTQSEQKNKKDSTYYLHDTAFNKKCFNN